MTKNKHIALLVLLLLSFSACQFASFTERPGVIVKSYPEPMYGTYQHIEKSKGVSDTHTLVVSAAGAPHRFTSRSIQESIREAGFEPQLRNQQYEFREMPANLVEQVITY